MLWAWLLSLTMRGGRRYDDWRWRVIARYVRARHGHRCRRCGYHAAALHVHHKRAVRGGGSHLPTNLVALCADCHAQVHGYLVGERYGGRVEALMLADWLCIVLGVVLGVTAVLPGVALLIHICRHDEH